MLAYIKERPFVLADDIGGFMETMTRLIKVRRTFSNQPPPTPPPPLGPIISGLNIRSKYLVT